MKNTLRRRIYIYLHMKFCELTGKKMIKEYTAIYKYKNSVLGILESVSADYDHMNLDVNDLYNKMADPNNLSLLKDSKTLNNITKTAKVVKIVPKEKDFLYIRNRAVSAGNVIEHNNKIYIAFANSTELLLYLGCTESVYLKSKVVTDFDTEVFNNILAQAAHWFRFHKDEE